jgi:hypothetical protein
MSQQDYFAQLAMPRPQQPNPINQLLGNIGDTVTGFMAAGKKEAGTKADMLAKLARIQLAQGDQEGAYGLMSQAVPLYNQSTGLNLTPDKFRTQTQAPTVQQTVGDGTPGSEGHDYVPVNSIPGVGTTPTSMQTTTTYNPKAMESMARLMAPPEKPWVSNAGDVTTDPLTLQQTQNAFKPQTADNPLWQQYTQARIDRLENGGGKGGVTWSSPYDRGDGVLVQDGSNGMQRAAPTAKAGRAPKTPNFKQYVEQHLGDAIPTVMNPQEIEARVRQDVAAASTGAIKPSGAALYHLQTQARTKYQQMNDAARAKLAEQRQKYQSAIGTGQAPDAPAGGGQQSAPQSQFMQHFTKLMTPALRAAGKL